MVRGRVEGFENLKIPIFLKIGSNYCCTPDSDELGQTKEITSVLLHFIYILASLTVQGKVCIPSFVKNKAISQSELPQCTLHNSVIIYTNS